jgi:26S proteasome regulatory subunit N2
MPKMEFRSNAKPSMFAYPPALEEKKKEESEKVETAVLSITNKKRLPPVATPATPSSTIANVFPNHEEMIAQLQTPIEDMDVDNAPDLPRVDDQPRYVSATREEHCIVPPA